jgi:phytoene dehydrogenase-like protein
MTIHAQFAPYQLRDGAAWDQTARETLLKNVIATLNDYAPNVDDAIVGYDVLTPCDLEDTYGLTHGSLNHGELTLDQLFFMRPVPGYARYRTPVDRLYMCGASTHPGGGMTGVSAFNAAREILRDK